MPSTDDPTALASRTIELSGMTVPQIVAHRAAVHGDRVAVEYVADDDETPKTSWTYRELWDRIASIAAAIDELSESGNVLPSDLRDAAQASAQRRAVLLYPPGLDFIAAFFAAQVAGYIPVPTCYPKPHRVMPRLNSAATDCDPALLLSTDSVLQTLAADKLSEAAAAATPVATDVIPPAAAEIGEAARRRAAEISPESVAFLQYTSGSTSEPKGVVVTHANLCANVDAIQKGFALQFGSDNVDRPTYGVFWLPAYHDMGLIGGIITPLYLGYASVYLSPRSFLQRPVRWLQLISDHHATISGAPNFAFQLCIDRIPPDQTDSLELGSWTTAFCGAEPIVYRTLYDFEMRFSAAGFRSDAFYPCYGLAEATLLAAGGDGPSAIKSINVRRKSLDTDTIEIVPDGQGKEFVRLVACGHAIDRSEIRIVCPESRRSLENRRVGEIWLRGPGMSGGYWNHPDTNPDEFAAQLVDEEASGDGEGNLSAGYCRTGDLGFVFENELYVTGRRKDVVILRGRNLYPHDLETTATRAVASICDAQSDAPELVASEPLASEPLASEPLAPGAHGHGGLAVAITVAAPRGEALAIIAEVPRHAAEATLPKIVRAIRREVIDVHEVDPRQVVLVRPASIPVTTSGKVRRSRCRELLVGDEFKSRFTYNRSSASEQAPIPIPSLPARIDDANLAAVSTAIRDWLCQWLIARAGVSPADIDCDTPFAAYGLDSMTAVELSGELEDWSGVNLTPESAFLHPTVADLGGYVADQLKVDESV